MQETWRQRTTSERIGLRKGCLLRKVVLGIVRTLNNRRLVVSVDLVVDLLRIVVSWFELVHRSCSHIISISRLCLNTVIIPVQVLIWILKYRSALRVSDGMHFSADLILIVRLSVAFCVIEVMAVLLVTSETTCPAAKYETYRHDRPETATRRSVVAR